MPTKTSTSPSRFIQELDPAEVLENQDLARRLAWEIASIHLHIQEIRSAWAGSLGISGPQWMILIALTDLDQGDGVPVKVVSKMLNVDPSFITTQSKMLEKKGFLRRKTSQQDARVVRMSLTEKTYEQIGSLDSERETLKDLILSEFSERELADFTNKLITMRSLLEKASLKTTLGI